MCIPRSKSRQLAPKQTKRHVMNEAPGTSFYYSEKVMQVIRPTGLLLKRRTEATYEEVV